MNCPKCGMPLNMSDAFCQNCGYSMTNQVGNTMIGVNSSPSVNNPNMNQNTVVKKTLPFHNDNENYAKGFLGALLGILIGMIVTIIAFKLGYLVTVSGAITAIVTILLYKKFAKSISKEGLIICGITIAIGVFLAYNLAVAITLRIVLAEMGFKLSVIKVLFAVGSLMKQDYFPMTQYLISIGFIYLFTFLGGYVTVKMIMSKQ